MRGTVPRADPRPREAWLDVARGVTILLVVLMHADLMLEAVGERDMWLHLLALALVPLRMPLFFLVAGILAAGMLARPAGRVLTERVGYYLWVWAVWTALGYGVVNAVLAPALGLPNIGGLFEARTDPVTHLLSSNNWAWFLYALALFFAASLALRSLPPALVLAVALLLAVPGLLDWGDGVGVRVVDRFYFYPYFVLGWLGAARFRAVVPRLSGWGTCLALCGLWAVSTAVAHALGWLEEPQGRLLLSLVAVPAALSASALAAARMRRLAWPFAVLGTSTLVVYLLHPWLLLLLVQLDRPAALLPPWAWALALIAAATAVPVLVEPALRRVPGLLALPWRARPAPARRSRGGSSPPETRPARVQGLS
jgi:uncharacterized membrane protein YcfT